MLYLDGWNGYSDGSYQCSIWMVGTATVIGGIDAQSGLCKISLLFCTLFGITCSEPLNTFVCIMALSQDLTGG